MYIQIGKNNFFNTELIWRINSRNDADIYIYTASSSTPHYISFDSKEERDEEFIKLKRVLCRNY